MRRLAWFAAYWLLGVVVLTAIALLIRLFLVPFTQGSS
jgi:hypothetical protein